MSIRSPKIPSTFRAIDSAWFASLGPSLDAFSADTIAQAHNRLVAGAAPMFCCPVPVEDVAYGEQTIPRYTVQVGPSWGQLLGPIVTRKKPGATRADFRAILKIPTDLFVDLQVTTSAAPQQNRPGHVTVKGTGDWEVYAIDGVPVYDGAEEMCALWARSSGSFSTAPTTYGSPVTGDVWFADWAGVVCTATGGGAVSWNVAPATTFAAAGYLVTVSDPYGVAVQTARITGVDVFNTTTTGGVDWGILRCSLDPQAWNAIGATPGTWTWEIVEGRVVSLASLSAATVERVR